MYYGNQYWHGRSLKVICVGVMVIEDNFLLKHYINYWEGNTCRKKWVAIVFLMKLQIKMRNVINDEEMSITVIKSQRIGSILFIFLCFCEVESISDGTRY